MNHSRLDEQVLTAQFTAVVDSSNICCGRNGDAVTAEVETTSPELTVPGERIGDTVREEMSETNGIVSDTATETPPSMTPADSTQQHSVVM